MSDCGDDDDFTSDLKKNLQKIKEKKLKLAQISNYLSPISQPPKPPPPCDVPKGSSKYFEVKTKSDVEAAAAATTSRKGCADFEFKPTRKFSRTESSDEASSNDPPPPQPRSNPKNKVKSAELNEEPATPPKTDDPKSKINETILRDAVPNCPICSKVFHTFNQRQNHLKKCAQVFRIRTECLVELIKKQQERIERELSKGLVPSEVFIPQLKKKLGLPRNRSKKLDDTQVQLTSLGIFSSGAKLASSKKKSKLDLEPPKLLQVDFETRACQLSKRFELILSHKVVYPKEEDGSEASSSLVKSKFVGNESYLWNKCKYFRESKENFYVQSFVDSGQFLVNNRVFIDKVDERRFSNVQVINTQTAYLLADLNDTSQRENLSIYYTQISRLQQSITNQSIRDNDDDLRLDFTQANVDESRAAHMNKQQSSQQLKSARNLFEETIAEQDEENQENQDFSSPKNNAPTQHLISKLPQSQEKGQIFIDETMMDEAEGEQQTSDVPTASRESESESGSNDAGTNICDRTLGEIIDLEDDDDESDAILDSNRPQTSKLDPPVAKKRKSIDVIELSDDECDELEPKKTLGLIVEEESSKKLKLDEVIEIASSNSRTTETEDDEFMDENELLSLLNKTSPKVSKSDQINNSPFANQTLDDVWRNFSDNQDEIVDYGANNNQDLSILETSTRPNPASKQPQPTQTEAKDVDESMSDFDVDEFLKNYRDKHSSTKSPSGGNKEAVASNQAPAAEKEKHEPPVVETPINNRLLSSVRQQAQQQGGDLTPMPNYRDMDTPNLKIELKRFGIKALPRRQAILKLTEIYEYTHRHKLAALPRSHSFNNLKDLAADLAQEKGKKGPENSGKAATTKEPIKKKPTMKKAISDLNLNTNLIGKNQFGAQIPEDCEMPPPPALLKIGAAKKPPRPPSSKQAKQAEQRLQECTLDDKMLELIEQDDDAEGESSPEKAGLFITASQRARKQSKILDEDETRKFVHEFLKNEPNLYLSVLSYEPIDYEKIFAEMQVALNPRRVNNKVLMKCLDELCVTFTLKAVNAKSFGSQRAKTKPKK